ncbi:hypothetical protein LAUMK7_03561 [Mycobacterium kansasii]|nr:hypothetical protein LAUMK40_03602 [Mycobacterium kansasii]VAZ76877.1 hypothetical protein LAUMK7_03561 [Mycobacterium kansasii]
MFAPPTLWVPTFPLPTLRLPTFPLPTLRLPSLANPRLETAELPKKPATSEPTLATPETLAGVPRSRVLVLSKPDTVLPKFAMPETRSPTFL